MTRDDPTTLALRYLGGPTVLLELAGLRFLTDPTFDPPGDYPVGDRTLTKTIGAVVDPASSVGSTRCCSPDQHPDNLDRLGRAYLADALLVLSTSAAERRLGGTARALAAWSEVELERPDGGTIRVVGVPARHGPPGCEPLTGEVVGFVLIGEGLPTVYISGDNAGLEHVQEVAERFRPVDVAVLFAGAARTALLDGADLTLTSDQAAAAASLLDARHVVPVHFEGWAHFSQGRASLEEAFAAAGLLSRTHLLQPGQRVVL